MEPSDEGQKNTTEGNLIVDRTSKERGGMCAGCGEFYSEWLVVQIDNGNHVRSTAFSPCCYRLQVSTRIADELVQPQRVVERDVACEQEHPHILNPDLIGQPTADECDN